MRRERLEPARVLPVALLLVAMLIGLAPAPAPALARQPEQGGFAAPAGTPFATPDLRMPTGGIAAGAALSAEAGMRPAGPGARMSQPAQPFAARERAPALQQSAACAPMLTNPTLDSGYDWTVITQSVYTSDGTAYYSAPDALWFQDGADGADEAPGEDAFGQDFYFPADAESALIEFQIAYSPDSQDDFDHVFYEFYLVDDDGLLVDFDGDPSNRITPVGSGEVPQFLDNEWHPVSDFVTLPAIIGPLQGQRVALVLRSLTDDAAPSEAVYFDNIQVTACTSTERPTGAVSGAVSGAADPSDALLALFSLDSAGEPALVDVVTPDAGGAYSFRNLYPPPADGAYQVWYINTGEDGRLSFWAGPLIDSFAGDQAAGGDFSLADAGLLSPPHYEPIAFPATFTWQTRGRAGERYYLCIYEADSFSEVCTEQPIAGGSYTIDSAGALQGIPGFSFSYGKRYGWYVRVAGPDFDGKRFAHLGSSGYSRFVSFVQQAQTPVQPPPSESAPPPAGDPDPDRWTIMFYLAGDDEQLSHGGAGARDMVDVLTNLSTLGDSFPDVNIVAQFDFYETAQRPLPAGLRGTQRCYFRPGVTRLADACQQLGELNSGDPATLRDFLSYALGSHAAADERTMLVIMGHGSTVSGVAGDQTQPAGEPDDALRPDELELAFQGAGLGASRRKLDLLVFYACLMGSFETAAIMSPFADYMVASPNIATLIDINRQILDRASKSVDPRAVAGGVVSDYNAALSAYNQSSAVKLSISMAAYDLRQVAAARPKIEALGAALRDNLSRQEVRDIRAAVQLYDSSAPVLWGNATQQGEDALVDLRHLANLLATRPGLPADVRSSALALCTGGAGCQNGLGGLIVQSVARDGRADLRVPGQHLLANSLGLAIYFPNNSAEGNQAALTRDYLLYYRQTGFRASAWVQLVDATRTGLPSLPRRSSLGSAEPARGTLQNFTAPEVFPVATSLPASAAGARLYLPLLRR